MPILAPLHSLGRDDLVSILTQPKNAITKQYASLMSFDGVKLEFEPEALNAIADRAIEMQIGARGLRSVMEDVMTEIMYSVPSDNRIERVVITADSVRKTAAPLIYRRGRTQSAS